MALGRAEEAFPESKCLSQGWFMTCLCLQREGSPVAPGRPQASPFPRARMVPAWLGPSRPWECLLKTLPRAFLLALLGPSSPLESPWAHSGLLRVLSAVGLLALSVVCTKLA